MWWWVGLGLVYVGRQGMSRYVYYQSYLRQFCELALHFLVLGHEFLSFCLAEHLVLFIIALILRALSLPQLLLEVFRNPALHRRQLIPTTLRTRTSLLWVNHGSIQEDVGYIVLHLRRWEGGIQDVYSQGISAKFTHPLMGGFALCFQAAHLLLARMRAVAERIYARAPCTNFGLKLLIGLLLVLEHGPELLGCDLTCARTTSAAKVSFMCAHKRTTVQVRCAPASAHSMMSLKA